MSRLHLSSGLVLWCPLPTTAPGHSCFSDRGSVWSTVSLGISTSSSPGVRETLCCLSIPPSWSRWALRLPCEAPDSSSSSGLLKVWSTLPGSLFLSFSLTGHLRLHFMCGPFKVLFKWTFVWEPRASPAERYHWTAFTWALLALCPLEFFKIYF